MGKYVTLLEIGRKQKYIFKSNRLAENVGASVMIKNATEQEAKKYYEPYHPKIIYEGGGNALYIFPSREDGLSFAKNYSKSLLKKYPGMILYLVGYELKEQETVKDGIAQCYKLLAAKKETRAHGVQQIDYGKTVRCTSTNLPATSHGTVRLPADRDQKPLSAEALEKYRNSGLFNRMIEDICPEGFSFPLKGDDLGRSIGDKSYIAIIHIDGNRMGEKINKFNEKRIPHSKETKEEFDERYIKELGLFSQTIRENYETTFREMCKIVADNMEVLKEKLDLQDGYLPVRPLILAGDDICFLSDGRIGVDLMRIFLEKLQQKEICGIKMHACGGAAIVKAHYPFSRAYELAEELCQNAKRHIPEGDDISVMDWHIEQSELDEDLKAIRNHYIAADNSLLYMRPYTVGNREQPNDIEHFLDALNIISEKGGVRKIARSKVKGLRDISRKGKLAAKYYLKSNQITEQLGRTNDLRSDESDSFLFYNGAYHSLLFDAIEAMDLYIGLEEKE